MSTSGWKIYGLMGVQSPPGQGIASIPEKTCLCETFKKQSFYGRATEVMETGIHASSTGITHPRAYIFG